MEVALGDICGHEDVVTRFTNPDELIRRKSHRRGRNYKKSLSSFDRSDWAGLLLKAKYPRYKSHMTACEICQITSPDNWNTYFKFCFERNPWDKMVSHYFFKREAHGLVNFDDYWQKGTNGKVPGFHETLHSWKQYFLEDKLAVDQVFKVEELDLALEKITNRLGLDRPLEMPKFRAKSNYRPPGVHYQDVINEEHAEQIAHHCKWIIEYLDYSY